VIEEPTASRVPRVLERAVARVLGIRGVRALRAVVAGYGAAGGSLMASGLAYRALFALVPGILLILGISGNVLGDTRLHDRFVSVVVGVIPPLRDLLEPAVDELTDRAGSSTILGLLGLAWGASQFYTAFEDALSRVLGGVSRRGFVRRTMLGVLSVVALGVVFLLVTVLAGVRAFVTAAEATGGRPLTGLVALLLDLAGPVATSVSVSAVYRLVPPRRATWRAIIPPAILVTAALVVVARLFVYLAPRLIGAASVLGTVATAFAALAWLSLSFQAVLLGAAWIDVRDRAAAEARTAPS
jgi:membrane protein